MVSWWLKKNPKWTYLDPAPVESFKFHIYCIRRIDVPKRVSKTKIANTYNNFDESLAHIYCSLEILTEHMGFQN